MKIEKLSKDIIDILSVDDTELSKIIVNKSLNNEFLGQYCNRENEKDTTSIKFSNSSVIVDVQIKNNKVITIKKGLEIKNNAVMVDNPFVLDTSYNFYEAKNHNGDLYSLLSKADEDTVSEAFSELIGLKKLTRVIKKLQTVLTGNFTVNTNGEEVYKENETSTPVFLTNLSTGLKTFVIIQKLIFNNALDENSILILDEPEIHLHPEWQIVYAELIVLLQIELNIKVLITTHSPYFLNAIEVFTKKYKTNLPNYYLSEATNGSIEFINANDDLEKIYNLLAKPFQTLENIEYGG